MLESALPGIEEELKNGSPEAKRQLFIGLASIVVPQGIKASTLESGIANVVRNAQMPELKLNNLSGNRSERA